MRLLVELLRAHTPSTDGSFGTRTIVCGRRGLRITDVVPQGGYTRRICFSDGHTGGIYPYKMPHHTSAPEDKFRLMREYICELQERRRSHARPRARRGLSRTAAAAAAAPRERTPGEGGNLASAFEQP